jgi:hypothetical protein
VKLPDHRAGSLNSACKMKISAVFTGLFLFLAAENELNLNLIYPQQGVKPEL